MALEDWVNLASQENPTFKFWLLVPKYQQIIFNINGSSSSWSIPLCLYFAFDHQNYARWLPILIRYLESLPEGIREEFDTKHWTITRSNHRFPSLLTDQGHAQANKRVKGAGGMIGLIENAALLESWIVTGRKFAVSLRNSHM